ncbi:hypothetical protein C4D60_Mb08t22430 [Musa balbisiana]|uniref:Hydroxyproline O-arabinosyltransferase-like domain-containing protein n=1 Tax=Musa balbisiana TaxID=52838 RepID=A0A4S8K5P5_MUSBA|nr:hypothetical protein C4D60_Mb08t22430 [Musa balbisiana]
MGRASPLFLVLLGLGVFFATYNLVTLVIHHQRRERRAELPGVDPVTRMPDELRRTEGSRRPFHVVSITTCVLHAFLMWCQGYVVLNRPWAFVQWLEKATIKEEYILMAEPDHVFVRPLPNLAREDYPAGFPFFYIKPAEHSQIIRKFFPKEKGPVTNIDPIGNSPVIIKKSKLEKIAPTWMNISLKMKEDPETDKAFGWVLEMYAYAIASALHGVQHILRKDFMIQPPWDLKLDNTFIIHFTYGCDYTLKGELTYGKIGEWRFDKRSFLHGPPPRNLSLPPPGVPESVGLVPLDQREKREEEGEGGEEEKVDMDKVTLVKMVNEATANIPNWDDGR